MIFIQNLFYDKKCYVIYVTLNQSLTIDYLEVLHNWCTRRKKALLKAIEHDSEDIGLSLGITTCFSDTFFLISQTFKVTLFGCFNFEWSVQLRKCHFGRNEI